MSFNISFMKKVHITLLILLMVVVVYIIQVNAARWDPVPGELFRIDRFIQRNEVNGVTLDSRPLSPYSENIRLSVIPQLLGYYELYKKDNNPRYYEDIVDRADFLVGNFDLIRSSSPFDGMLGYALLSAYEVTGDDMYFSKGQTIVNYCIKQPQGSEMSLNWGLMCAMALGKYYELTNDTISLNRAKIIIDSLVPIQNLDGSFPHYCANTRDILYTAWMSNEFIVIKDSFSYRDMDRMLEKTYWFLKDRYNSNGQPVYRARNATRQWVNYWSQGSGCLQDYDTRGWINELSYTLLNFDHFNDKNEYLNVAYFLVSLSDNGAYKDKWAYPHQLDDPVYLYSIGDPSVIRTSNIFWTLTMTYTHSGSSPRVPRVYNYSHEYE